MTRAAPWNRTPPARAASIRVLHAVGLSHDLPPPFADLGSQCPPRHELGPHCGSFDDEPSPSASVKPSVRAVPSDACEVVVNTAADDGWVLASTAVPNAAVMCDDDFRKAAEVRMRALLGSLPPSSTHALARMWSFVPAIDVPSRDGDRYRTFNAGRAAAFAALDLVSTALPAASGVGHAGTALAMHALAVRGSARSIENPRQTPSWRYSRQFGSPPPLFARGCIVATPRREVFFASGTASVVGEASRHADDPERQMEETLRNLESLCAAARLDPAVALQHLRVHLHPRAAERLECMRRSISAFVPKAMCEFVVAPLCRPELSIEVEGGNWGPDA